MNENKHLEQIGKTYSMFDKDSRVNSCRARTIFYFTKGPEVLELGCADGLVTELLAEKFPTLIAVDASSELIEKAKLKVPGVTFHVSLFEDFQPNKKFDTIILGHVLEHVLDPVLILNIVKKWLKPSGIIIVTVPNGESLHRRIGVEMGLIKHGTELNEDDIRIGHRRVFTIQTLRSVFFASGLNILKEEGIMLKPLSNKQMLDWPEELFNAFYTLGKILPVDMGGELCVIGNYSGSEGNI